MGGGCVGGVGEEGGGERQHVILSLCALIVVHTIELQRKACHIVVFTMFKRNILREP